MTVISKAAFISQNVSKLDAQEWERLAEWAVLTADYSKSHHKRLMDEIHTWWTANERLAAIVWNACTWTGTDPEMCWPLVAADTQTDEPEDTEEDFLTILVDDSEDFAPIHFEAVAGDCLALADCMGDDDAAALADEMADDEDGEYIWVVEDWS